MQRHVVICRQSNAKHSDPGAFTTLEHVHSEDGWSWAQAPVGGMFLLKSHIEKLVERIAGVDPDLLPNVTITRRSVAEIEADPPLTDCWYGRLLDTQPGVSIGILASIRFEDKKRTQYEMWTGLTRIIGGSEGNAPMITCNGKTRFIARTLGQEILRWFNAAEERVGYAGDTFKGWANTDNTREEFWIRPQLEVGSPEFLPDVFPLPTPIPTPSPAFIEAKAEGDKVRRIIRQQKSMRGSQGYTFNPQRQSWGKPE